MLLLPYNPAWPNHFKQIASILQAAVGNHLLTIHHIGSTAVPGLAAKPIIDIDMEYPLEGELKAITATLKTWVTTTTETRVSPATKSSSVSPPMRCTPSSTQSRITSTPARRTVPN